MLFKIFQERLIDNLVSLVERCGGFEIVRLSSFEKMRKNLPQLSLKFIERLTGLSLESLMLFIYFSFLKNCVPMSIMEIQFEVPFHIFMNGFGRNICVMFIRDTQFEATHLTMIENI